jgi:hypothetical protein
MQRLTIPALTALLVALLAMRAQAQPSPAALSRTPNDPAPTETHAHRTKALKRHRVILLRVDEVIAADTGEGIDQRLLPMGLRLESLFHYTTYRLVSHQVGRTECGTAIAFTLPGGWIVHVEPSAVRDDMIAMELMLFQGARPMMTTDVRLRNHGTLIVGGPHYQQGMLIIPIGADAPELAMPPGGPIGVSPEGTTPESAAPEATMPVPGSPESAGSPDDAAPREVPNP